MIQQHVMDHSFVDLVTMVVVVKSSMLIVYQFDHVPQEREREKSIMKKNLFDIHTSMYLATHRSIQIDSPKENFSFHTESIERKIYLWLIRNLYILEQHIFYDMQ